MKSRTGRARGRRITLSALQVGASLFALNRGCMNHNCLCSLSRTDPVPEKSRAVEGGCRAEALPPSVCVFPSEASLLLQTQTVMPGAGGREGAGEGAQREDGPVSGHVVTDPTSAQSSALCAAHLNEGME